MTTRGESPEERPARPESALDWARASGGSEFVLREMHREVRRRRIRHALAAVGATACLAASLWFVDSRNVRTAAPAVQVASARLLEIERRSLPDGTVVEINPGAELTLAFEPALRRVIVQGGEMLFHVAKDPARPFVVEAAGVTVRAVGTAFMVQVRPASLEVMVTEGRVAVQRVPEGAPDAMNRTGEAAVALDAGSRATVDTTTGDRPPRVEALSHEEIRQALAWRIPRLQFNSTALAEVVTMFNAQAGALRQPLLEVTDPVLARLPVSGTLRADDVDSLVRLLGAEFGIAAVMQDGRRVLEKR